MAMSEVESVVHDMRTRVEMKHLEHQVATKMIELQWTRARLDGALTCISKLEHETHEMDAFLAVEKQVVDDYVVKLETQVVQNRAVEKENEMPCPDLIPKHEYENVVAQNTVLATQLQHLRDTVQQQTQQLAHLDQPPATPELTTEPKDVHPDKHETTVNSADHVLKQRTEELDMIYSRFRAAMDTVWEKTMRIETLEKQFQDVATLKQRNQALETQLHALERQHVDKHRQWQHEKEQLDHKDQVAQWKRVKKDEQDALVTLVAEKEAVQVFVARYYGAAEAKCVQFVEKFKGLERQTKWREEETQKVVQRCTQIETCDAAVRVATGCNGYVGKSKWTRGDGQTWVRDAFHA
ncbi:hypothetical protein PsorP6_010133 [Peronosclerospora sorghi]|uniref:Uncharacterized protein n=1 Tax=Peronosclerospora sorghi TaxID=230839 RepID=A0ACC0VVZ1_9STRA|nr:hypothetical protein PsorP6_010133 [Peronosclerospora sorghi]